MIRREPPVLALLLLEGCERLGGPPPSAVSKFRDAASMKRRILLLLRRLASREGPPSGERWLDAAEWAAFAGFMVMRGHVGDTLLRGALRIVGTLAGGAAALLLVPIVAPSLVASSLTLALVGLVTLYPALTARRAYAWLFAGLTFAMVLLDRRQESGPAVPSLVTTRILQTVAGTSACVLVSLVSTLTARRRWPAVRGNRTAGLGWRRDALRHALQGAAALAIVPWAALLGARELAQAAITIMAAMMVPVASLAQSGLQPVSRRLLHRAAGCIAGAALAGLFLLPAKGQAWPLWLGAGVAVTIGRLIENSGHAAAYVGTQFVLAALMVLVPDSYADAAATPALERLIGILLGVALLEPVLLAWHVLARPASLIGGSGEQPIEPGAV